jgi:hypothetical protein
MVWSALGIDAKSPATTPNPAALKLDEAGRMSAVSAVDFRANS